MTAATDHIARVIADSGEIYPMAPVFQSRSVDCNELALLLRECRHQLPLAAASWNDDPDRMVASFHVKRILSLIYRVDAALAKASQ